MKLGAATAAGDPTACAHPLLWPLPPPHTPAGFTPEERASFAANLVEGCGLVDCFRAQHANVVGYTYFRWAACVCVRARGATRARPCAGRLPPPPLAADATAAPPPPPRSYRSVGARAKNAGWRLDHFLVSRALHPAVHDCYILGDVLGSDHCPLGLVLKL